MKLLKTKILKLRLATMQAKEILFKWLTTSNLTNDMLGPPNFADNPVPTREEFDSHYKDHYFDGSKPLNGQCYIIINDGKEIGQINYNEINTDTKSTKIDIWMADREFTGKGLGTEAITILYNYLGQMFECTRLYSSFKT